MSKKEQLRNSILEQLTAYHAEAFAARPFAVARKYKLWVIEDNCDALGSLCRGARIGSFGDIATLSFYPAHQITTKEFVLERKEVSRASS